jgi:hypothetical protein
VPFKEVVEAAVELRRAHPHPIGRRAERRHPLFQFASVNRLCLIRIRD